MHSYIFRNLACHRDPFFFSPYELIISCRYFEDRFRCTKSEADSEGCMNIASNNSSGSVSNMMIDVILKHLKLRNMCLAFCRLNIDYGNYFLLFISLIQTLDEIHSIQQTSCKCKQHTTFIHWLMYTIGSIWCIGPALGCSSPPYPTPRAAILQWVRERVPVE